MTLLSMFEALQNGPIGRFVDDQPATFTLIESVHLVALALLGAAMFTSDLRLLNVLLRDVPSKTVTDAAHRWFKWALITLLVSGFFMLSGIATKCYHNPYFRIKMIALAIAIAFTYLVRKPLLMGDHSNIRPLTLKLVGLASICIWTIVASAGRWIGFSG